MVASGVSPGLVSSALRWWQDAGVETNCGDLPADWFANSAQATPSSPTAKSTPPPQPLPATLSEMHAWLAEAANLPFAGPASARVAPFGTPGAHLMVLTDMPELEDVQSGQLLSGPAGELFDKMLAAMKLDRAQIYGAALCPARPAGGRLPSEAVEEMRRIALQHIALAAPKKLWLLGQSTGRTILGADGAAFGSRLQSLNHNGFTVTAIASLHPRVLLQQPKRKAQVWAEMQLLMGDNTA